MLYTICAHSVLMVLLNHLPRPVVYPPLVGQALNLETSIDGFHGRGFTSRGQESASVFSAAVCKIQASE